MNQTRAPCPLLPAALAPDALGGAGVRVRLVGGELTIEGDLDKQSAKALRLALDDSLWQAGARTLTDAGHVCPPPVLHATGKEAISRLPGLRWSGHDLIRLRPLTVREARRLVSFVERAWNNAIDALLGRQSLAVSFPISLWGAVLEGLQGEDEAALRKLIELYKVPIERMLCRRLSPAQASQIEVYDFVGWLFAEGRNRRARLRLADGRAGWFRGFLKYEVMTYLKLYPASPHRPLTALGDVGELAAPADDAADPDAQAFADDLIDKAMRWFQRHDRRSWRSTLLYGLGFRWSELAHADGVAASTALERVRKSQQVLWRFLRRQFLVDFVRSEEQTEAEIDALKPYLGIALSTYVREHGLTTLREIVANPRAADVVRYAAARTLEALLATPRHG